MVYANKRALLLVAVIATLSVSSPRFNADTGTCGGEVFTLPFTDVMGNQFFCQIAEAYFTGLTNGIDATHYSPSAAVSREQIAAFATRTMDQSIGRASRRAALDQFWPTQSENRIGVTEVAADPILVKSDGEDLWVVSTSFVSRVHGSDGRLLDTWTGVNSAYGVVVAMGRVFITGCCSQSLGGILYMIDPKQPQGAATMVTSDLPVGPQGIAFDGTRIWTANYGPPQNPDSGSVSIVSLNPTSVNTVTTGFSRPGGIIFDGANIWITDHGDNTLKKLDSSGNILLSRSIPVNPMFPAFDGTNIWVPASFKVVVVRAVGGLAGTVLATLTGNGLNSPNQAAFDGERIMVTNLSGDTVSLWKASDLTPLGSFSTGENTLPYGVCSDGINFWITLHAKNQLLRF